MIITHKEMNVNIFHNSVFVLEFDVLTKFKEKQCWKKKITEHGGTISYVFSHKVNYVVLFGDMLEKSSYKQRQAVRHKVPVLRCEFITDCIEQKQILPTATYAVGEPISGKNFKKGRIASQRKTKSYLSARRHVKSVNLNAIKSWSLDDPEAPSHNDDQYEVAKWALLKLKKSVQVIEVHALTSCDKFRLYHQEGHLDGEHILATEGPVVWYLDSADEVLVCFEQLYKRYTSGMINMEPWHTPKFVSNQIGSHKLKMTLDDLCSMKSELDPDVGQFVEMIWKEATQEAEKMLTMSMQHIKSDKVDDAMVILQQIKQVKKENQGDSRLAGLVEEFYNEALPHKRQYITQDLDSQTISQKLDLCQLIYDVLTVSEATDFSPAASTVAKYKALRCHMTKLDQSADKCQFIQNILKDSEQSIAVHSVFEVGRTIEDILFQSTAESIGNAQLLMHASGPQNLLGILSRGLLLPHTVVEEHGVNRTDGGKLGYGIYFSNSFNTCLKYAVPSAVTGLRMLVVCEVALGKCLDYNTVQSGLTAPPGGYHSCHGVKTTEKDPTEFLDDEFVIYTTSQQRVKYVVLFTLPGDPPLRPIQTMPEEEDNLEVQSSSVDIMELRDLPDPLSKVTSGLISKNKSVRVPLKAVHIRAKVIDMVAKVVVLQSYKNNMTEPIEAKYVFPLDEKAAVCGFEAFINGKHIIGEIKEKKTAHREYREAISKGHGAYLMDEEEPDVFTVSVGNLPPKSEVLIKVTYISELGVEGDGIALTIPATVAPWVRDAALAQQTQAETSVLQISDLMDCQISLQAAIEMPFEIRALKSGTHRLKYKKTETKAVVEIPKKSNFAEGFQLLIVLAEIHVPRMWVECDPEKDCQACMLAFYPEFEAAIDPTPEVIFLIDLSNSMKGDAFRDSRKVLLLALENLPEKASFNIVTFGSSFRELFQFPHRITKNSTNEAIKYIERANPVMGCSDVLSPLKSLYLLSPAEGSRCIFLISDGFVGNKELPVFQTVLENSSKNRLFCMGVGGNRDSHTLRSLANYGGGTYEYFNSKNKSKWQSKIALQMDQATRPGISQVKVEWGPLTDKLDPPLQAPSRIPSLFSTARLVVFGFVKNCTQANLKANVDGHEFETIVSTTELNFTEGKMLHQLAARAVIRDYEDGVLSDNKLHHKLIKQERKQHIIDLSKEFGIVTPYTSFVAIEERTEGEATEGPSIEELVNNESVDILTYMGWINPDNMDDKDPLECVEDLLRRANIAESFSQLEAERCYLSVLDYRQDLMQENNRAMIQKVLERTDKFFTSQDSEKARALQRQFHRYLPIPKQLEVRTLTGRSIPVVASTMAQLESEIMKREGLAKSCMRLFFNGKQLQETDNLDMEENSVIFLVLRLRGGLPSMQQQSFCSAPRAEEDQTTDGFDMVPSLAKKKMKKKKRLSEKEAEDLGVIEKKDNATVHVSPLGHSSMYLSNLNENSAYFDPKYGLNIKGVNSNSNNIQDGVPQCKKSLVDHQEESIVTARNGGNITDVPITAASNVSEFVNRELDINMMQIENELAEVENFSLASPEIDEISTLQSFQHSAKKCGFSLAAAVSPTSPALSPTSPAFSPTSPAYGPIPAVCPNSLAFSPTSLSFSHTSPAYPSSNTFSLSFPAFSTSSLLHTFYSTAPAFSLCSQSKSFNGYIDQKAGKEYSDEDVHVGSNNKVDDIEVDSDSVLERRPRPRYRSFDENEDLEENEKGDNIIQKCGKQEKSSYSGDRSSEKRNICLESEDQSFKKRGVREFDRSERNRDRGMNRSLDRRNRSKDRSWDRSDRSKDSTSWDGRSRSRDRSRDRSDKRRDSRSLDGRSRSRDRSRDRSDKRRDSRSLDRSDRRRDSRSLDGRSRSRDRSRNRSDKRRDRRSWDKSDRRRDSRSWDGRSRCRDRSWDRSDKRRDSRSWDRSDRRRDSRSWDGRSRSRDGSWDRSDKRRDSRRDRSRDGSWDGRDRSRERSWDRSNRRRDRRWDERDRGSDRSLDGRDRSRERSLDGRDRGRERSWDRSNRRRDRRWDERDRGRDRSLDGRYRSRKRSLDKRDGSRESRDSSCDSRNRRRHRDWDEMDRSRVRSTSKRNWNLESSDRSQDGSWDRDCSMDRRHRERDWNRDRSSGRERIHRGFESRNNIWKIIRDERMKRHRMKTEGKKSKKDRKYDEREKKQRTVKTCYRKKTQFELQLSKEELLNSLCLYENQFEEYVERRKNEVHCWTGYMHCPKINTSENLICKIDIWVNPQNKERVQNVLLPKTLYMTFLPEFLLRMSSMQSLVENAVQAIVGVHEAPAQFLPSGLIGCIEIEETEGHFEFVLAIQYSMDEPILFIIPEDGKAAAARLEGFVKEHRMQVNEYMLRLNETLSTDAPYIDMWKGVWNKDVSLSFNTLPPLNEDGLWRLDKDLAKALGISAGKLEQLLKNQGLLSLSKAFQNELLAVISTLLVGIFKFMHEFKRRKLPKWLCCCEHLIDISPNISSVLVNLQCMKELVSIEFDFPLEASIQLGKLKSKWTPYIRDLELGKNLTHLVDCLLRSLY